MSRFSKRSTVQPLLETLEARTVPAINHISLNPSGVLTIRTDDFPAPVFVQYFGTLRNELVQVKDGGTLVGSYPSARVLGIQFRGGAAADHFSALGIRVSINASGLGGNDALIGGNGPNTLNGGNGNDDLRGGNSNDSLNGNAGDDSISGGPGADSINGNDGDDRLNGDLGNDTLNGGDGNDTLEGGSGLDNLNCGNGNDAARGGDGDDTLNGWAGDDSLLGQNGNDVLHGGDGLDRLFGNNGNDTLNGGNGDDVLYGLNGRDTLFGNGGNDQVWGGLGDDAIHGESGNDTLHGEAGDDQLTGGGGDDLLYGEGGIDMLNGGAGNDHLLGGDGIDILLGGGGNDLLEGGESNDELRGDGGNDTLRGGGGNDILAGGLGNDQHFGDIGTDSLRDSSGSNIFHDADQGLFYSEFNVVVDGVNRTVRQEAKSDGGTRITSFGFVWLDTGPMDGTSSGCGRDDSQWVPDQLCGINMRAACEAHDQRYEDAGGNFFEMQLADLRLGIDIILDNPAYLLPKALFVGVAYWITTAAVGFVEEIWDDIVRYATAIDEAISAGWDAVSDFFVEQWNTIVSLYSSITDWFADLYSG